MGGSGYVNVAKLSYAILIAVMKKIMHIANILTLAFSLGCAWSPTVGSLIAFRFMSRSFLTQAI